MNKNHIIVEELRSIILDKNVTQLFVKNEEFSSTYKNVFENLKKELLKEILEKNKCVCGRELDAESEKLDEDILSWNEIYEAVSELEINVNGKLEKMFITVEKHDKSGNVLEAGTNTAVKVLNTTAYDAYINVANGQPADKVSKLKLFKKYYQQISYSRYAVDTYTTGGSPVEGRAIEIASAVIKPVDETLAANYVTYNNPADGTEPTITANTSVTINSGKEVFVDFNLVITDKFGMTMEVPFSVKVVDNR